MKAKKERQPEAVGVVEIKTFLPNGKTRVSRKRVDRCRRDEMLSDALSEQGKENDFSPENIQGRFS